MQKWVRLQGVISIEDVPYIEYDGPWWVREEEDDRYPNCVILSVAVRAGTVEEAKQRFFAECDDGFVVDQWLWEELLDSSISPFSVNETKQPWMDWPYPVLEEELQQIRAVAQDARFLEASSVCDVDSDLHDLAFETPPKLEKLLQKRTTVQYFRHEGALYRVLAQKMQVDWKCTPKQSTDSLVLWSSLSGTALPG